MELGKLPCYRYTTGACDGSRRGAQYTSMVAVKASRPAAGADGPTRQKAGRGAGFRCLTGYETYRYDATGILPSPPIIRSANMSHEIDYGVNSVLTIERPPDVLIAECVSPRGVRGSDVTEKVAAALASPLGFPLLSQATIPGDRVTIALGEGVPQADRVVAAIVDELVRGSDPESIAVVCAPSDHSLAEAELMAQLAPADRDRVGLVHHDPHDREALAYVAANDSAEPIYLNRAIVDADFVVPVGCLRAESSAGYHGLHSVLFPRFSDEKTQRRFRDPQGVSQPETRERQRAEVAQAAWLLGVQFTVQIVRGAHDTVLQVLTGLADDVAAHATNLAGDAIACSVPHRAGLVVAAIDGDPTQQTWDNFARALAAASRVVAEDGVIAVCCDLDAAPGAALSCLVEEEVSEVALREIDRERTADTLPAAWLLHVLDRHTIFLLSHLDEPIVEDLGMAYLADTEDLARLSLQFDSCIILGGAHRMVPTAVSDMVDVE